jgi:hypothetical protein
MKRIWVTIVSVVLGLWFGYYLGYHRGQQGELAAWRATQQVEVDAKDGQILKMSQWSPPSREGVRKLVNRPSVHQLRVYYEDPHAKPGMVLSPRQAENVPDPRSMLVNPREGERPREP